MLLSVQDEIFDMVKPADPLHLTLQDLITRYCTYIHRQLQLYISCSYAMYTTTCWQGRSVWPQMLQYSLPHDTCHPPYVCIYSGQGETVVSILIDLTGFWTYENREVLLSENQDIGAG